MDKHTWLTRRNEEYFNLIMEYTEEWLTQAISNGMHLNAAYPLKAFGDLLDAVDLHAEIHSPIASWDFLDIGCGTGQLVAIASEMFGYEAHGMDYSGEYADRAEELFEKLPSHRYTQVWQQDADTLTRGDMDHYDVVTLNRLYVGPMKQTELEARVASNLKPGGYLIKLNNVSMPEGWEIVSRNTLGGVAIRKPM